MAATLRQYEDYKEHFDSKAYVETLFSHIEEYEFTKFRLNTLHKLFSTGDFKGKLLLDVGSGPCIHTVIPAAKWFEEIVLTDYCKANRDMQEKWLRKEQDAHDWEIFFKYYSQLAEKEDQWQELEQTLRQKIQHVLFCDVHLSSPLHPVQLELADAICSSACLESACADVSSYNQAMKNIVTLLKPGGKLILIGILNCPFYTVGTEKFQCLSLTKEQVLNAVTNAGLKVVQCFDDDSSYHGEEASYNGSVIVVAEK